MTQFKRILCPTDFSDASLKAFPYAIELARLFRAEIFFIHVVPIITPSSPEFDFVSLAATLSEDAAQQLEELLNKQIPKNIRTRRIVAQGHAAEEILRAADKHGIDLITMATHGLTGWSHMIFGSVAEKVVRMAKVPVMTVGGKVRAGKPEEKLVEEVRSH
jgi:nucleotide-binding universal stress UspA family protein